MASVPADRRYRSGRRCPVCNGADSDPRGSERRCFGFLSDDGMYVHCSREEHAGSLKLSDGSQTYGHRRTGPCGCGTQHAVAEIQPRQERRIVATYDYRDESGALVYQVVRFEPKQFRQRRPDPENPERWLWNLEGVRRVLYHLDRVLEAPPEQTIYIVEGEKDVEALESLGLVATCNPQGAGKWSAVTDCANAALCGRDVVVIADADDKGRQHAADVAAKVAQVAAAVRGIELPGAKDAADWVRDGGTADQIAQIISDPAPARQPIDPSKDFDRSKKSGTIYHSQHNIRLALAKLGVSVAYDEFARRINVSGLPGYGPEYDDAASVNLRLTIDERFNFRIGKDLFADVISNEAQAGRYHPVLDYLGSLHHDGTPRVGGPDHPSWLTTYAGAPDTPYVRAVGRMLLVAAVRRVRDPGCIYQELVILESAQGKNKSTALAVLAVKKEWFTDDYPLGGETRRLLEATMGRWIVEAGELKGMSRSEVAVLKNQLSRTHDESRLAYGKTSTKVARQYVAIGTTNPDGEYLRDATGNRRFLPVIIEEFDLDALKRDRDQLWAEAAALERSGVSIRLDPALYADAAEEQDERTTVDPMDLIVCEAFEGLVGKIRISDAWNVLGIRDRPLTDLEMTRFGTAMRKNGWARRRVREGNGQRSFVYARGNAWESEKWLVVTGCGKDAVIRPAL